MNMRTNEINSDSSERKYVHLSNGLIQSFEICYTFRVWIYSGRCGFISWECHTYPLFGGGLQLSFAIFLVSYRVCRNFKIWIHSVVRLDKREKACEVATSPFIAWRMRLLDCMKCSTLNSDSFTRWSLSNENEVLYGRIVVCLSQEQLGYSTKYIIHWN